MKKISTLLLLGLMIFLSSFGQQNSLDEVISALQSGSASQLSKYFDSNVELTLPEKSDNYSKAQAEVIVKDFFANNGVKSFEVKHKSYDTQRGGFVIGNISGKSGKYRTTVYMRVKNDRQFVKEIRFQAID